MEAVFSDRAITFHREIAAAETLYPLRSSINGKYGYVDEKGVWVCPPSFVGAQVFERGRAPVNIDGKWALINHHGDRLSSVSFDSINHRSEGPSRVVVSRKVGLLDETRGGLIIEPQFDYASAYSCGLCHAIMNLNDAIPRHGYLTTEGEFILPAPIGQTGDFRQDRALAREPGSSSNWGYIDKYKLCCHEQDFMAIPAQFEDGVNFSEGLASVRIGRKWGAIDRDGSWVVDPIFDGPIFFREGMSRAVQGGVIGFIDKQGEWVLTLDDVDYVWDCYEGIFPAAVQCPGQESECWGFMTLSGDWLLEPKFLATKPFHRGLGEVRLHNGKIGFIDRNGGWIVPPKYADAWIEGELVFVSFGEQQGYLSLEGEPLTFDGSEVR